MSTKLWTGAVSGSVAVAGNWSPSGVPTTGDDVWFDGAVSVVDADSGLSGSGTLSGVALASIHVLDSYTGKIGTATQPLVCEATNIYLHEPSNQANATGSRRISLDLGSSQFALVVYGSATQGADTSLPPIRIIGTNASNVARILGGAVIGFAVGDASELCTLAELNTGPSSAGAVPNATLGVGTTLGIVEVGGGDVVNRGAAVTTLTVAIGTYSAYGTGAHTTINARGGTVNYNSSGTIGTAIVGNSAMLDLSQDSRAKTISNLTLNAGASLNLDNGNPLSVTLTNGIDLNQCGPQDVTLRLWRHVSLALSAV